MLLQGPRLIQEGVVVLDLSEEEAISVMGQNETTISEEEAEEDLRIPNQPVRCVEGTGTLQPIAIKGTTSHTWAKNRT